MAFVTANRVKDYTTTSGTGSITLATTPPTGFNQFNGSVATGSTLHYCIVDGLNYEIGLGTFTEPTTLARTTPIETKYNGVLDITSPSAIPLSGDECEVFVTLIATGIPYQASGTFTPVLKSTTTWTSTTHTLQSGEYTIVGDLCFYNIVLSWTALNGTGNYFVDGLPFANASSQPSLVPLVLEKITFGAHPLALIPAAASYMTLYTELTNASVQGLPIDTDYTATPQKLTATGVYKITA